MALSENYRTETIGRSDCRPIVRLSADTIVRWDYRPNPTVSYSHFALSNALNQPFSAVRSQFLGAVKQCEKLDIQGCYPVE